MASAKEARRGGCGLSLAGQPAAGKASRSARRLAAFRVVAASTASTDQHQALLGADWPSWTVTAPVFAIFLPVLTATGFYHGRRLSPWRHRAAVSNFREHRLGR